MLVRAISEATVCAVVGRARSAIGLWSADRERQPTDMTQRRPSATDEGDEAEPVARGKCQEHSRD